MTELTKRMLIAAVAAAVLIGGSVAAFALTDDDDDEEPRLVAIAGEIDDSIELDDLVADLLDRIGRDARDNDGPAGRLPDLLEELFEGGLEGRAGTLPELFERFLDDLGRDLTPVEPAVPPEAPPLDPGEALPRPAPDPVPVPDESDDRFRFRFGPRDRPLFPFGDRFEEGEPFLFPGSDLEALLREFFADGRLTPEERDELRQLLPDGFGRRGFGFRFPDGVFVVPSDPGFGLPFGERRLDRFLEDGILSPEEALELQRFFEERFPEGAFEFRFEPAPTDVPGDALLDALGELPLREFLEDGALSPREQAALQSAIDRWLDQIFGRFGVTAP